ncbi:MAG TPA: phosphatidate cytidylyltransferase [Rhodospirillaceae bacterium]|nr:phosphatidate cytidylyltransferase [Rhodospirillaceae bacterium]
MLLPRILSALVLAPLALAAVWFGAASFAVLAAVAGVVAAWEWTRLCLGRFGPGGWVLALMTVVVTILGPHFPLAAVAGFLWAAVTAPLVQRSAGRSPLWMAGGAFYIGLPLLALVWVRELDRATLLWLLLIIWSTDIGAYIAGRLIGGPKLMPRVSPKKTWAGLVGGVASAGLVGAAVADYLLVNPWPLAAVSMALGVVAQGGDLAESWVKRYFGVKDSSGIIPGHGGVLDRLDGLLATAPVVAATCLAFQGGLTEWR